MPTAYQELAEDEFTYATDWLEMLDPAAEDSVSNSAMEATLVGIVPFNKVRACARHFLGYSYADDASPYYLYREPPAFHPRWPNLYAHGVSFRGFNPLANAANPNSHPYTTSPFDAALRTGKFEMALVTVRFRSFGRMRFLADDDIASSEDEWRRYTQVTTSPRIEALSADGGSQLIFAEGASFFGTTGPTAGITPFAAPVAVLLSKCAFVVTWMHVPHNYISASDLILKPTKLLACVGKTNDATFMDVFERGELLMEPPVFEPVLFPVVAENAFDLMTGWNVTIPFNFFSPQNAAGSAFRGHNLMPHRNGGFYLATRNGLTTGARLLPEADFSQIFTHVSAP